MKVEKLGKLRGWMNLRLCERCTSVISRSKPRYHCDICGANVCSGCARRVAVPWRSSPDDRARGDTPRARATPLPVETLLASGGTPRARVTASPKDTLLSIAGPHTPQARCTDGRAHQQPKSPMSVPPATGTLLLPASCLRPCLESLKPTSVWPAALSCITSNNPMSQGKSTPHAQMWQTALAQRPQTPPARNVAHHSHGGSGISFSREVEWIFYDEEDVLEKELTRICVPIRPDGQTGRQRSPDQVHATWCPGGAACLQHGGRNWYAELGQFADGCLSNCVHTAQPMLPSTRPVDRCDSPRRPRSFTDDSLERLLQRRSFLDSLPQFQRKTFLDFLPPQLGYPPQTNPFFVPTQYQPRQ
jgi:hypothetical protein